MKPIIPPLALKPKFDLAKVDWATICDSDSDSDSDEDINDTPEYEEDNEYDRVDYWLMADKCK